MLNGMVSLELVKEVETVPQQFSILQLISKKSGLYKIEFEHANKQLSFPFYYAVDSDITSKDALVMLSALLNTSIFEDYNPLYEMDSFNPLFNVVYQLEENFTVEEITMFLVDPKTFIEEIIQ